MKLEDRYRPKPKHWSGTAGAQPVDTDGLIEARIAFDDAQKENGIIAFDGPPGTGKSFALKSIIEDLVIPHWFIPIGPDSTGKGFEAGLLQAIYAGKKPPVWVDRSRYRDDLRWDIHGELSQGPCVVFIDDFDPSGLAGTKVIRWLFEQAGLQATFVLVGNDLYQLFHRNVAFWNRIMRFVSFARIPGAEVVAKMQAYHPFFKRSSEVHLAKVDKDNGLGNFRNWAIFLEASLKIANEAGVDRLTDEVIDAAYVAIGKRPHRAAEHDE